MRLLYATNGFPYPPTSGYLRHWHLLQQLRARGHEVDLLALVAADHRSEYELPVLDVVRRLATFPTNRRARSAVAKARAALRSPLGGEPAARRLAGVAADWIAAERYDAVILSGKQTTPVLGVLGDLPLVVDLCDATADRLVRELRAAPGLARRARLGRRALATAVAERRLLGAAHASAAASARDAAKLARLHPNRPAPAVLANGVDLAYWRRTTPVRGDGTIVFAGRMGYEPNAQAAVHLVRQVLPLVWEAVPSATALLVGRDPPPAVVELASDPRVVVTGEVADVRPHLEAATVSAAPLLSAAGIQNKVLEALAMELPVVATAEAAGGLRLAGAAAPPVDVRDGAPELAAGLIAWLRDPDRRPVAAGREHVARHFSWEAAGDQLEQLVARAVATASGASPTGRSGDR